MYRGLLLGTGPLVDPGFISKLSFPLHNLTDEEYTLSAEEIIIYLEFSKISERPEWNPLNKRTALEEQHGTYKPLDPRKLMRLDLDDYLNHANAGHAIRSSIPIEINNARQAAKSSENKAEEAACASVKASKAVESTKRRITLAAWIVGALTSLGLFVAVIVMWVEINQLAQGVKDEALVIMRTNISSDLSQIESHIDNISQRLLMLNEKTDSMNIEEFEIELNLLREELDDLKSTISSNKPSSNDE